MTRASFPHVILLFAMLSVGFIIGSAYPARSFAQSTNYPSTTLQLVDQKAKAFATGLNSKDTNALSGLCEQSYYQKLTPYLQGPAAGHCLFVGNSLRVYDNNTFCFYVEWKHKGLTRLELVTLKIVGQTPTVCYGPIPNP